VTNGLEISPTGSKDTRFAVPATMPAIASTGAMLTLGHMGANEGLGHNCRIGSRIRVARGGSQGKFLGASDDIKMPSTLTTSTNRVVQLIGRLSPPTTHRTRSPRSQSEL
jgi:hypothetical protein